MSGARGEPMAPVDLAGMLAEAGVRLLVLTRPGQAAQTLHARETDLPGLLADAPEGARLSTAVGARVFVRRGEGWQDEKADR